MPADLYLRNGRVVTETGEFQGSAVIDAGKITYLIQGDLPVAADDVIDCTGKWILPGLIDMHAHFSEPGRGHWEGFRTGTMAAAAGGITTVIEMPLNASPPTIAAEHLRAKQAVVAQQALVDVALWGGLVDNNEDRHCLANVDAIAAVPGIGFAEWGPGDMGMSFGHPDAHDPPYPPEMNDARNKIKAALDQQGIAFYSSWADPRLSMEHRIDYSIDVLGVKMMGAPNKAWADYGRRRTGRTMPV